MCLNEFCHIHSSYYIVICSFQFFRDRILRILFLELILTNFKESFFATYHFFFTLLPDPLLLLDEDDLDLAAELDLEAPDRVIVALVPLPVLVLPELFLIFLPGDVFTVLLCS